MFKSIYRSGFTLIEVLIALTISGLLLTILISTFFDTYVFSQEMAVRTSLLSDSKIILDTMAQEIRDGKIDFEEYFQQCVVIDDGYHCPNDTMLVENVDEFDTYGEDHGLYEWQFYEGGIFYDNSGNEQIDGVGVLCQRPDGVGGFEEVRVPNSDCVSGNLSYSEDFNTGVFGDNLSSSICSVNYFELSKDNNGVPQPMVPKTPGNGSCSNTLLNRNVFDELYIINADETKKTIYAREKVSDGGDGGFALSKLEMVADASASSGGIELVDYVCASNYNCTGPDGVDRTDLYDVSDDIFDDFVPVTPLKVTVEELKFIINPMEDASKAFGEFSSETQVPPRVTILMTLKASPDYFVFGLKEDYELKIQRTVVASVD